MVIIKKGKSVAKHRYVCALYTGLVAKYRISLCVIGRLDLCFYPLFIVCRIMAFKINIKKIRTTVKNITRQIKICTLYRRTFHAIKFSKALPYHDSHKLFPERAGTFCDLFTKIYGNMPHSYYNPLCVYIV